MTAVQAVSDLVQPWATLFSNSRLHRAVICGLTITFVSGLLLAFADVEHVPDFSQLMPW
jgi:hypothetical protein